jgi:hypothetical protein
MSFRGLRTIRDKMQAKSFVTDPQPPGVVKGDIPDGALPPPPEKLGFRYALPDSMEMKTVPAKGRAIFSTVDIKPGLLQFVIGFRFQALIPGSRHHTTFQPTSCAGVIHSEYLAILFLLLWGACDQTLFLLSDCLVL